ncbi:hypothetical protein I7X29_02780 [Capnocytophaga sp. p1a2]|nr:hypothetical protein [Capnocytophaga periodontitidis]
MTAKYFYISFLLLFTACRQSSNVKYNTINHEQDSIKEIAVNNNDSVLEKIPIKVFYRILVSNEQRIEIDTLSSLTIYKDYIIDKLSMDYYLINIDSIEQDDTKIYFTSSKESSYVDFEENQLIKWNTLTLEWYRNTVIEKDKKKMFIWNLQHDNSLFSMLIDSIDIKKSKYPIYQWKE